MFKKKTLVLGIASLGLLVGGTALAAGHGHGHGKDHGHTHGHAQGKAHQHGEGHGHHEGHHKGHHDGHGHGALRLNDGKKWETDANLRKAMTTIRGDVAAAMGPAHEGKFTATQYEALAGKIEEQLLFIVANCELPPASDAQFHILLADYFGAVAKMKEAKGQRDGVVTMVKGLRAYGKHFDHPGWMDIEH